VHERIEQTSVADELGEAATDSFVQRAGRRVLRSVEW